MDNAHLQHSGTISPPVAAKWRGLLMRVALYTSSSSCWGRRLRRERALDTLYDTQEQGITVDSWQPDIHVAVMGASPP